MKLRKYEKGFTGGYLSYFTIFKVIDENQETLSKVVEIFNESEIEYSLLIGRYSLLQAITEEIKHRYTIQCISDQYCIASRKPTHAHNIPNAEIIDINKNYFLVSIRGTAILYTPKLSSCRDIPNIDNVHIVCCEDHEYDPETDTDLDNLGWIYYPNYPTFHTFMNRNYNLDLYDFSLRIGEFTVVCILYIPYWQIEYLRQTMTMLQTA